MADIDFGTGPGTGDNLPTALGKVQAGYKAAQATSDTNATAIASTKIAYAEDLSSGGSLANSHLGKVVFAGGAVNVPLASGYQNGDTFTVWFTEGAGSLAGAIVVASMPQGAAVTLIRRGGQWMARYSGFSTSSPTPTPGPTPTPSTTYEAIWHIIDWTGDASNGDYSNLKELVHYSDDSLETPIPVTTDQFDGNSAFNSPSLAFDGTDDPYTFGPLAADGTPRWIGRKFASPMRPLSASWKRGGPFFNFSRKTYVGTWANRGTTNGVLLLTDVVQPAELGVMLFAYPQGA